MEFLKREARWETKTVHQLVEHFSSHDARRPSIASKRRIEVNLVQA
jgi:hypothetical protein